MKSRNSKSAGKIFCSLVFSFISLIYFSCMSFQQDIVMSTDSQVQLEDILRIEEKLAVVDGANICNELTKDELNLKCSEILTDIEDSIQRLGMNKAVLARLYALEGRVYLINGSKSKAKKNYRQSLESCKGDSQTIILGSRLGIIKDLNDETLVAGSNENALLILERSLNYYNENEFKKCVAEIESAFLLLPDFYKTAYLNVRNCAWQFRNIAEFTDDKKIIELIKNSKLTVGQMLLITQATTNLLDDYTNGKTLSEKKLFAKLKDFEILNSASNEEQTKIILSKDEMLTRAVCARIEWNIYAEKKGLQKKNYSDFYRGNSLNSPVEDVDVFDEDFDAVLGCVETEIINLIDGNNFQPNSQPQGIEVLNWIQNARK